MEKKSRTKVNADWRGKYVSSWRRAPGTAQNWLRKGSRLAQDWLRTGLELTADELDEALA